MLKYRQSELLRGHLEDCVMMLRKFPVVRRRRQGANQACFVVVVYSTCSAQVMIVLFVGYGSRGVVGPRGQIACVREKVRGPGARACSPSTELVTEGVSVVYKLFV
jgi:hypothetical protein